MYCVELRTELEANKSSEIIPELFIDSAGNRTQSVRILSTHAESCHVGVIPCDRVVNVLSIGKIEMMLMIMSGLKGEIFEKKILTSRSVQSFVLFLKCFEHHEQSRVFNCK